MGVTGRRKYEWAWLALGLACQSPAGPSSTPSATATTVQPRSSNPAAPSAVPAPSGGSLVDLEFTTGGADRGERLPWLVALHGLGDRPEAFARLLQGLPLQLHVHVPRAPIEYGRGYDWFGVRVDGDPERLSEAITRSAERVAELIERTRRDPRHQGKPLVTGFSQGGMLSFALALQHADSVAASFPIGGALPKPLWPSARPSTVVPIVAFHGASDRVVPLVPTETAVAHLDALGFPARIETYPELGHSIDARLREDWVQALAAALAAETAAPR